MRSEELGVRSSFLIPLSSFLILLLLASCPSQPEPVGEPQTADRGRSPNTRRLLNYLSDQYGEYIISGQMDTSWTENSTMDMIARVYADTGKYPAIKGFDFIGLPQTGAGFGRNQVDEAIEWWDGKNRMDGAAAAKLLPDQPDIHGIITFCWHWRTGSAQDFNTNRTTFRIPMKDGKLDTASAEGQTIKNDLDKVADLLQLLKDKDIPVLWRPLHEASGGWFWWGASGPAAYIALWEYMFDYLANTRELNNLIWVWNGQSAEWFPRPDTVDIVGFDVYALPRNYDSQEGKFGETQVMPPERNRMVALTENGAIPDPDSCKADNAMWLWFLTWNDARNTSGETHRDNFWTGEYHNTQAHKEHVYNHDLVITLDELPDLTLYRLE
jgi:mannan endo-1,4-beta-mannosidase